MAVGVAVLGSTGSIGRTTLAILERHPERFRAVALAANRSAADLSEQVERHAPNLAVLARPDTSVPGPTGAGTEWRTGGDALLAAATHGEADIVVNAVVGAAGLQATLAALEAGKRLALANKESLVAGGPLVLDALRRGGGELVPIDSEHSAILQCLDGAPQSTISRLILTASGGPFREWPADALAEATPADALRHPTWEMGDKISIDSATLVNKALEVIEAHFLFGISYDNIEVVVHPQSIIHSMVEFVDGSVLAQVGYPNMELPILYALTYPERVGDRIGGFDPTAASPLTFEPVDDERFPALRLGLRAARAGGTAPAVFNAANEAAVAGFLRERIPFPAIARVIEHALDEHDGGRAGSIADVMEADGRARAAARQWMEERC